MTLLRPLTRLPTCSLGIRQNPAGLIEEIVFLPPDVSPETASDATARLFCTQIAAYLDNAHTLLNLPLAARGTPFQQRVWHAIRNIPAGHTRHYGELAKELGSAARAIGQACGANPYPLITPCHRVLSKSGLGGFAHAQEGWLLDTKRWLLQHEGVI